MSTIVETIEVDNITETTQVEFITELLGEPGPQGPAGNDGADGAAGVGVPAGGTTGQVLAKVSDTDFDTDWVDQTGGGGGGSGTVTSVSVTTANGVSGTVTNPTTTPAISLNLGNITPASVVATGSVSGANLSGTNTGDQDLSGYALTSSLATVATSGSYNDLDDLPTIPTLTSELTNDSGFLTSAVLTFNTRSGAVTLLSGDVTGALGFTPYNATNPAGYTTNTGTVTNVATGAGLTGGPITGTGTVSLNAGSIASLALADTAVQPGDNVSDLVNDSGYLTSINSGNVITALGYTPYNATNPSGYTSNTGTVTTVSVTTANGVSGSVATAGTTPAISLTLGAITPTSVVASGTVTGSNLSGTNTGDQTLNSLLPTQTGNSGKFLTTNGTNASWDTPAGGGGSSGFEQTFLLMGA